MPTITVKTDSHVSNFDAMEAVQRWMLDSHRFRNAVEREYTATSGRKVKVNRLPQKDEMDFSKCSFKVTIVAEKVAGQKGPKGAFKTAPRKTKESKQKAAEKA